MLNFALQIESSHKAKDVKHTADTQVPLHNVGMGKDRKGDSVKTEEVQSPSGSQASDNSQQREIIKTTQPHQRPAHHSPVFKTLYRKHVKLLLAKWNSRV